MASFSHKRSLGQNFLTNTQIVSKIIDSAHLSPKDNIVEVGPGQGVLTRSLAKNAGKIIAIEIDERLIDELRKSFSEYEHVEIVAGDILHANLPRLIERHNIKDYKVVANIPYYITAPILRLFLESSCKPSEIILMVQKEVAERLCANPGNMSMLGFMAQYYAHVEYLFTVSRENFEPSPRVDSAVVRLRVKYLQDDEGMRQSVFRLAKIGFSARRKKLVNNLANGLHLPKKDIEDILTKKFGMSPTIRAQELSVDDWISLAQIFRKEGKLSK